MTGSKLHPGSLPVALDAMGGDYAPRETVAGAVRAARGDGAAVTLVGDAEQIAAELARHDASGLPLTIVPAQGIVTEGEQPARAFRSKPRASIFVATQLVKLGKASGVVSMGSSGAAIAAATVMLGTFEGIERPCLGGPIIGMAPETVLIDVGANVDCRPRQLADFAALGAAMARLLLGNDNPRVALLSVGVEKGKGNRQVKETTVLLEQSGLNFIGNVEANDLLFGRADVVVCDGFTGNVVMKLMEGLGESLSAEVRRRFDGRADPAEVDALSRHIYEITNRVEGYGGGPLFGIQGISIVGHGKARAAAIANAIGTARWAAQTSFVEEGEKALGRLRAALA